MAVMLVGAQMRYSAGWKAGHMKMALGTAAIEEGRHKVYYIVSYQSARFGQHVARQMSIACQFARMLAEGAQLP